MQKIPTSVNEIPEFKELHVIPGKQFPSFLLTERYIKTTQTGLLERGVSGGGRRCYLEISGGNDPYGNKLPYTVDGINKNGDPIKVAVNINFGPSTLYTPMNESEFLFMYCNAWNASHPAYEKDPKLKEENEENFAWQIFDPERANMKKLTEIDRRIKAESYVASLRANNKETELVNLALILGIPTIEPKMRDLMLLEMANKNYDKLLAKIPEQNDMYPIEVLMQLAVENEFAQNKDGHYWVGQQVMGNTPESFAATLKEYPSIVDSLLNSPQMKGKVKEIKKGVLKILGTEG
jgi:hypothetical protein